MLIYKATSQTTGKVYIGLTSQTLEQRMTQHKSRSLTGKDNCHFHNAIRKYGFEDFVFEVVEDGIKDEATLNQREKYWIDYYNSYEEGYNSTRGGDGNIRRDDELITKLFLEGKTTKEICVITGYNRGTIFKSFKMTGLSEENRKRVGERTALRCGRPVLQYDLEGNFIKRWDSATECGREFGNQSLISSVCRQENHILSAYGYLFKYEDDSRPIEEWVTRLKNKKAAGKPAKRIAQKDSEGNIIQIYNSAADASRAIGLDDKSCVCRAARKKGRSHGYYWEYI